jgi:hypothetical protein
MPLLGYLVGLNGSPAAYFFLCALVLLVGGAATIMALRRRFGDETTRLLLLVFGALPLFNVLLTWIGYGDPLVVILSSLLLVYPHAIARAALGVLLAVAHFEQALVIAVLVAALAPFVDEDRGFSKSSVAAMAIGVILGSIGLELFFVVNQLQVQSSRLAYTRELGAIRLFREALRQPLALLFSVLNVAWAVFGVILWAAYGSRRSFFLVAGSGMLLCLIVTCFVLDSTRVASIVTWPLVLAAVVIAARDPRNGEILRKACAACFFAGLLVPRIIVWEGQIHTSTASFTVMMITDTLGLTEWIDQSKPFWRIAPFRQWW